MSAAGVPTNAKQLAALLKKGKGPTLEFNRSTGEVKEGMQTLCASPTSYEVACNGTGRRAPGSRCSSRRSANTDGYR